MLLFKLRWLNEMFVQLTLRGCIEDIFNARVNLKCHRTIIEAALIRLLVALEAAS